MLTETIKTRVIGVNIAYEETSYALVDVRGNILAKESFSTEDYPNINEFVGHLSDSIVTMVEQQCGYGNVRSVGISVPSGNFLTGCIEDAPHLAWKGVIPLAAMLRDRLGLAVALANRAHVRALAEYSYGSAHGMKDFLVVALGHGLGSCMFSNGHAYMGARGFGGEMGHVCVKINGRQCDCGLKGCLEAYCASEGIVRTAQELLEENDAPSMMRDCEELTPKTISEFCEQGDQLAIETYQRTGQALGVGLANYASVINPEAIILTGGISKAGKWLLEPTNKSFEQHVFHNVRGRVKLLISTLSDVEHDLLGASALAWRVKEYSLFK